MSYLHPTTRQVVITGVGVICPLGKSKEALWESLAAGKSGVAALELASAPALPTAAAGAARGFTGDIGDFGPLEPEQKKAIRKGLKTVCREAQMGIAAAQLALADAGLRQGNFDPDRTGTVFGSDYMVSLPDDFVVAVIRSLGEDGKFDFARWGQKGLREMNPLWLLKYLPNMPASHIAIYNDLRGPSNSITHREASANLAVGEAARTIARGSADRMIAGATGTWIHPLKSLHIALQQELARNGSDPTRACRPFDLDRTGMVLGEGAGAVILEARETALARGATILGEVVANASSQVADRNFQVNRRAALANVIRATLREAGMKPHEVGHIHAHGLGSRSADIDEAQAIRDIFGEPDRQPPVVAAKSYFGNLGAGSGLVELAASLLALLHRRLFPILNYETPDPECPIAAVTFSDARPGTSFLNLNITAQGQASAVIVRSS